MPKIYLSPSNQSNNLYCVGGTNEREQMEALAFKIKSILDADYACESVMATLTLGIDANGRPKEARDLGCDVYLAIHSNAGGGGSASGAEAFYHPDSKTGKALAANIVAGLNAVCPVKSNRAQPVANGMAAFDGYGYGEVRVPTQYGMFAVLAETDFHDNPATARWIIDSKDIIAQAYVGAITKTLSISPKQKPDAPPASELYRVQIGAFSVKANADAMLAKARAAGFSDAFIKAD